MEAVLFIAVVVAIAWLAFSDHETSCTHDCNQGRNCTCRKPK